MILLLVRQPASNAQGTSALLRAEAHTSEPRRFQVQAWTSSGVPTKSLSSKAAAVPSPGVCWSSRGPATRLPELPWAPAPATKKPSILLPCPSLLVHSSHKACNSSLVLATRPATGLAQASTVHYCKTLPSLLAFLLKFRAQQWQLYDNTLGTICCHDADTISPASASPHSRLVLAA